ncbi:MAG: tetratricopeptide repeat protein [Spirochaetes bacterium]|nr:tetratricopeptide repeat protein [Spirochaetota bacterium]
MKCILNIFFISALLIQCSSEKKEPLENTSEEEYKITKNARINTELKEQRDSLENADLTDVQRAEIYTSISELNSEKGNVTEAIKSAQEAIKFQPNQYSSRFLLGKSLIEAARYDEAIAQLEQSGSLYEKYAPAHFELANAYYKKYRYKDALKEYQITTQLDKGHYEAYNNMGVLYSLMKKPALAEKNFRQSVKIKPDFAPAYRNLGLLYDLKLKKPKLAILNYEKYLEYMPNSPQRKNVMYWIKTLKEN